MASRKPDQDVAQRIESLREQIRHHDHLYFVLNRPEISDPQYDRLVADLRELEAQYPHLITPDSPTQRVGERPAEGFAHVRHAVPMLSIDNTYSAEELRKFDERVRKGLEGEPYEYVVDPKIDGVAVSLRYQEGRFAQGATRGDGETGDDITQNLRAVRSVPLRLRGQGWPHVLEVRGEVYWPRSDFNETNRRLADAGKPLFANPRNATAGTLKQLDARIVASRGLAFTAHGFGLIEPLPAGVTEHTQLFEHFRAWGIPVSPHARRCPTIEEVIAFVEEWEHARRQLDYETDGLVVKVNRLDQRERLGATSKAPRWCIAYKYAAEQAQSRLLSVDFQVGKLGTITPVANLEPVQLSGTTVKRATLHNPWHIERLDLHEGDLVLVEKAGEIIPQVVGVVESARDAGAQRVKVPTSCPACKHPVTHDEPDAREVVFRCENRSCADAFKAVVRRKPRQDCVRCGNPVVVVDSLPLLRCRNPECPAQLRERLIHFCSRYAMDVENLGPSTLDAILKLGWVRKIADIYALKEHREELAQVPGFGYKSVDALLSGIERSKRQPLARVLVGLNIEQVGTATAEKLAKEFGTIDQLLSASEKDINKALSVQDSWIRAWAESIHRYLRSPEWHQLRRQCSPGAPLKVLERARIPLLEERELTRKQREALARRFPDLPSLMHATEADLRAVLGRSSIPTAADLRKRLHSERMPEEHSTRPDVVDQLRVLTVPVVKRRGIPRKRLGELCKHFDSIESLEKASVKELQIAFVTATGVTAKAVYSFFHVEGGDNVVASLMRVGVNMRQPRRPGGVSQPLANKTVVVTGTLERFSRNEIEVLIRKLGGKVSSSVSSKTDMLVCGSSPGSKLDKARVLGVEVIDEVEFLKRTGGI